MNDKIFDEINELFGDDPEVVTFDESLYDVDLAVIMTSG